MRFRLRSLRIPRLAQAAVIVMMGFLLSKIAGVARQIIIAQVFGPGADLDAYFVAFTAPDLIFMLISGGALATAFIPIFTEYIDREGDSDRRAAWRMASNILTISVMVAVVAALLLALLAEPVVKYLIAPKFTPENQALTVSLMRIILLSTVVFSVSGLVTGVLHSLQHFLMPAFAPLFYNLGIVFGALVIVPMMPEGQGVYGLAWGSVIGALLHLTVQLPALAHFRFRFRPILDLRDPDMWRVARLMAPRAAALGLIYSKFAIRSNLASRLPEGSVSVIDFAWDLMQLPETLFGTALALAIFPTLAELWTAGQRERLARTYNQSIRIVLALTVPAAIGLAALSTPIVRLFYEGGNFDAAASAAVSYTLTFFAFGIIVHSLLEVVARLFYAQKDTLRPLYAAALMLVVTGVVSWGLLERLGTGAIALGDSVGVLVEVAVLMWWLRYRLPEASSDATVGAVIKIVIASAGMALVLFGWQAAISGVPLIVEVVSGTLVGLATYTALGLLLRLEEMRMIPDLFLRRRIATEEAGF